MNKIFLTILIVILIASTAYFTMNPAKIKEVRFYDSSVKVENQETKSESPAPKIVKKEVAPKPQIQKVQPIKTTPKKLIETPPKPIQAPKQTPMPKAIQKTPVAKKTTPEPKPIPIKAPVQTKKTEPKTPVQKTTVKTVQKPKTETKTPPKIVQNTPPPQKVLSEREETIAWNQWRANVANELLRLSNFKKQTSKTHIPARTHIFFNFDVDINGNISNISIRTTPSSSLSAAKNFYTPLIMMMNRKPVVKFPEGTKRTNVTVSDEMEIIPSSEKANYADPSSYSDYEKIKIKP